MSFLLKSTRLFDDFGTDLYNCYYCHAWPKYIKDVLFLATNKCLIEIESQLHKGWQFLFMKIAAVEAVQGLDQGDPVIFPNILMLGHKCKTCFSKFLPCLLHVAFTNEAIELPQRLLGLRVWCRHLHCNTTHKRFVHRDGDRHAPGMTLPKAQCIRLSRASVDNCMSKYPTPFQNNSFGLLW